MTKRKMLDVEVLDEYVDFYDVLEDKTPVQVVEAMAYYQERFAGRDVYFAIQSYGYDGGKELKLRERREENDREFQKRLDEENKAKAKLRDEKAKQKEREFAEYERLKKKFEK